MKFMWLRWWWWWRRTIIVFLFPPPAISADCEEVLSFQGFMIVDRSALYGSRNTVDQHRDMRLDVDNMSYEVIINLRHTFFFPFIFGYLDFNYFMSNETNRNFLHSGNVLGVSAQACLKIWCSSVWLKQFIVRRIKAKRKGVA